MKYTNGSELGVAIIDGKPVKMFPFTKVVYILGEVNRISIWSPNGSFHGTVMNKYRIDESAAQNISMREIVIDRLGDMYVYVNPGRIVRFNRTSSTCKHSSV